MDVVARGAVSGIAGNGEAEVTGSADHPVLKSPSKRHIPIDPDFQSHLQEEQEARDFSTFLALP